MPCANTTTYADRLTNHINTYINLVTDNPSVRFNEFAQLASYADLKNPKNMIEVPAEGKLLELFYPNVNIHRADFLKINTADYGDSVLLTDWTLANIKPNFYDAVVSLAPIHHANKDQKKQYVKGAFKALKTNGILAFGEVELASKLHIFLDEFINSYSATGHVGQYPNAEFNQVIEAQGFKQVSSECRNCNWQF